MALKKYISEDKYLELVKYMTAIIGLMPIVPYIVSSISMIIWILLTALYFAIYSKPISFRTSTFKKKFWLLSGNYFLFAISLLYTSDMHEGAKMMQQSLVMLIIPMGVLLLTITPIDAKRTVHLSMTCFWVSSVLLAMYLLGYFIFNGQLQRFSQADNFDSFFRDTADRLTKKHPTYLSYYFGFALFLVTQQFSPVRYWKNTALIICACSLLAVTVLMASRSPIVAILCGFGLVYWIRIKSRRLRIAFLASMAITSLLIVRFTPAIYSRVLETINTNFEPPIGIHHNSTNIRAGIISCSLQIIGENFWLGVGVGDDRNSLNSCYRNFDTDAYEIQFYNTHNQYLNIFLLTGVFSLLLFLILQINIFLNSFHNKDFVLLFFIVIVSIGFLTENLISRQAGIVFYYYVCSLRLWLRQIS